MQIYRLSESSVSLLPTTHNPRHTANCPGSWNSIDMPVEFLLAAGYGLSLAATSAGKRLAGSQRPFDGINQQLGLRQEAGRRSGRYRCRNAVPTKD
uniref:hypothetical protein n=1 Tax=Trichocoleus desertorum TaxID=1481672 RepID=UPI0025B4AF12|nr:hypothetical protein [Trichocoleus desertorum]